MVSAVHLVPPACGMERPGWRNGRSTLFRGLTHMLIMVCYDISDDKRRQQLSTELENFGNRVQYSVFECHLNDAQFAELQERLLPLIDEAVDKLRYYPLCGKDVAAVLIDGKGTLSKDWDYFIV